MRAAAAHLTTKFREAQIDTIRPGLTLEDGSLVVTDNYLKVRVGAGKARNERVQVRLTSVSEGAVVS